jgi:FAD dependent oxidoreductase
LNSLVSRRQVLRYLSCGPLIASAGLLGGCAGVQDSSAPSSPSTSFDVVVIGGTPSGLMAAVAAAKNGMTVAIVEWTNHLGGTLSSGLCVTDSQNFRYMGGLARRFYQDLGAHYGKATSVYAFEPRAAESVFISYIEKNKIAVFFKRHVQSVSMSGNVISSIVLNDGTQLSASQWVDASYEADLMALSGCSFSVGRESASAYSESAAGWGHGNLITSVSPYISGSSGSLIAGVNPNPNETFRQGDGIVMAYTFRACITNDRTRMQPFPKPSGYDPSRYEGLSRFIVSLGLTNLSDIVVMQPTIGSKFNLLTAPQYAASPIGYNPFSTNYVGGGWAYPNADWTQRMAIWQDHYDYVVGWLYFVGNDPSVPQSIQNQINTYGLPTDEFTDNGNWPWQMYVREGRRLIGSYVMTQADVTTNPAKSDSIGMMNWYVDGHICEAYVADSKPSQAVGFDGYIVKDVSNYQIPYRALLPNPSQVTNLAVTCALSSTHVAFSSLRVEPTLMILGEAAGTAAALAVKAKVSLQEVQVPTLQNTLLSNGAVLTPQSGS